MVEIMQARAGEPVIVGGGLAGLITALRLAPMRVTVLVRHPLGFEAASAWAQGGVAAALGEDDAPELHAADTSAAGDGLCDPAIVERVTAAAPAAIEWLARMGVPFARDAEGRFRLGLEAAHGRHRIAHAGGDGTGAAIMRAVIREVSQTPSIAVMSGMEARRVIVSDGRVEACSRPDRPDVSSSRRGVWSWRRGEPQRSTAILRTRWARTAQASRSRRSPAPSSPIWSSCNSTRPASTSGAIRCRS
jgi:aspartate oxidase